MKEKSITFPMPFDAHLHFRQGSMLQLVVPHTAGWTWGATCMPNTDPPIINAEGARTYRDKILRTARISDPLFTPFVPLYLTHETTPKMVRDAWEKGLIHAVKLYPKGATTSSDEGVILDRLSELDPVFRLMQDRGIPLLIHGEVVPNGTDEMSFWENIQSQFDREARFVNEVLINLAQQYPKLKIVLEHISSREGIEFVTSPKPEAANVYGTLTAHHLTYCWDDVYDANSGTLNPHRFCYPIIKGTEHRDALRAHIDSPKVGLGTDSAPHLFETKERSEMKGVFLPGGCFTAPNALPMYLRVFEEEGKLNAFEAFACRNIPEQVYGLTPPADLPRFRATACASYPGTNTVSMCLIDPMFRVETTLAWGDMLHWRVERA